MSMEYFDPRREPLATSLPDVEVFHSDDYPSEDGEEQLEPGYYWWACFPGCLPDSEPRGPFATYEEALADAREGIDDDD